MSCCWWWGHPWSRRPRDKKMSCCLWWLSTTRRRNVFFPVVGTFIKRRPRDEEMTIACDRDKYGEGDHETKRSLVACVGELLWWRRLWDTSLSHRQYDKEKFSMGEGQVRSDETKILLVSLTKRPRDTTRCHVAFFCFYASTGTISTIQ